jgi:hypothetical protein
MNHVLMKTRTNSEIMKTIRVDIENMYLNICIFDLY